MPSGRSDSGLTTSVHVVHAREFRGGSHRNPKVDAAELADWAEELPILSFLRVMRRSRAQKFVAGAVSARAAVVHWRGAPLSSPEKGKGDPLRRVRGSGQEGGA